MDAKATHLIRTENHEIVANDGVGLCSFFVPGDIDAAFRENSWAVGDMVEVLTDIVRDKTTRTIERRDGSVVLEPIVTAREKMAAMAMLDKKAKEALILGGLIVKDRLTAKKTTEDGTEIEYNEEGMRLTEEGTSRLKSTLALLEGASQSKSDEVLDVDPEGNVTTERHEDADTTTRSDESGGGGPSDGSLLPRQPRGDDPNHKPVRRITGSGSGHDGSGGDDVCGSLHGVERSDASDACWEGPDYDEGPIGGTENEREAGLLLESGGGVENAGAGEEGELDGGGDLPDPVAPKRPVIPGESGVKRTNWWEPGTPRRAADSDPGSIRDCVTAESSLDRLKRIERARKQAAEAAAGYLERRAKNKRTRPGESNEHGTGGRLNTAPEPA